MTAKMVSKPFRRDSREDWDIVRNEIMYWCLRVKLAQNFISFGLLLESTFDKPIVEESSKDDYWGAIRDRNDQETLRGVNALGRLLMKLRQVYNSPNRLALLVVEPLPIPNFFLFGKFMPEIDARDSFIALVHGSGKSSVTTTQQVTTSMEGKYDSVDFSLNLAKEKAFALTVVESNAQSLPNKVKSQTAYKKSAKNTESKSSKKKILITKKKIAPKNDIQPELPMTT
jgi:hypothetical protein